ncbi:ATP-binding protein [Desulfovibrio cuneatus]|uniref:ATP-binding protein n=1 Tax=Desulfovibrio cuneatus TaxID=159728 RepID=UPI0003FE31DA|nr:ATP-binding protein [Desulfovibrio cuneatus]
MRQNQIQPGPAMAHTPPANTATSLFPSWAALGIAAIIAALVAVFTVGNTRHQTAQMEALLQDRADMIIWAMESAARNVRGETYRANIPKQLFAEIAKQPEITYIAIVTSDGVIVAHSKPELVGSVLYSPATLKTLEAGNTSLSRMVTNDYGRVFEVYKIFTPTSILRPPMRMRHMRMRDMQEMHMQENEPQEAPQGDELIIVVGLTMETFEKALAAEHHATVLNALLLALAAFGGVLAIFWANKYQTSRRQLQNTQALAEEVINSLPVGLLTVDQEGTITRYNRFIPPLLGAAEGPGALLGTKLAAYNGANWQKLVAALDNDESLLEQEGLFASAAHEIPISLSAGKITDDAGQPLGYVFVLRDLSEVKQLEEQLRRNERLSALGTLAAGVAHEIRNPLSSIKGFALLLSNRFSPQDPAKETAKILIQEVERLNRVVSELLAFARPNNLNLTPTSLDHIISKTLRLAELDAQGKQITLKAEPAENLPDIPLDGERFTQALLNLVLNAVQATPVGGTVTISTGLHMGSQSMGSHSMGTRGKDPHVIVRVHDTGHGMDAETMQHIFSPYFTTKAAGTGLGLSIASGIITKHGGTLHATSTPGNGSTFTISLPLTQGAQHTMAPENFS